MPLVHRPTAAPCQIERLAVNCRGFGSDSRCQSDLECSESTTDPSVRCVSGADDTECQPYELCNCRTTPSASANACLSTECHTDDDCDDNYCSPSMDWLCGKYLGITAWRCHTARDRCLDDADCPGPSGFCAYFPEAGYWKCARGGCAG